MFDFDRRVGQGLCEVVLGLVAETEVILEVGIEIHQSKNWSRDVSGSFTGVRFLVTGS